MRFQLPQRPMRIVDDQTVYYDDAVLLTRSDAWTAVEIPHIPYAFKGHEERLSYGWASILSLAALKDGDVRIKVVRRPYSPSLWRHAAVEHAERVGNPSPLWLDHVDLQARRMATRQPSTKHVILLRRLGARNITQQFRPAALRAGEIESWTRQANQVRDLLARGGFQARPIDADMMRFLRRHALTRGLVPPRPTATSRRSWGPGEVVDEFGDVDVTPLTHGVRVDSPTGTVYTATLVMSTFPQDEKFPAVPPWLAHLDFVGSWAEADLSFTLLPPGPAKRQIVTRLRLAADQREEADKAGVDLPYEVAEMYALARELEWQVPRRRLPLATGHARIRVDASSEDELAFRVQRTMERYADEDSPHIDLMLPTGMAQADLLLEGIPGWKIKHDSWKQRWTCETVALSLPHAGSGLGHKDGLYAGPTTGRTQQVVTLNLHRPITRSEVDHIEGPGGFVMLGAPRAGKSGALGRIIDNSTLQGITNITIDFSGPLAKLADMPRHEGRIQVLNLLKTGGGVLDPMSSAVIPGDARVNRHVREARKHLTRDTLHLLAWRFLSARPEAESEMLRAITSAAEEPHPSLLRVVERLEHSSNPDRDTRLAAQGLAEQLRFELSSGDAEALTGEGEHVEMIEEPVTRIITAPGVSLPRPGTAMTDWMPAEALGAALFGVAAHLAHRLLWDMPPALLKFLLVDEAHIAMGTEAGRRVIELSLRDGPKHGCVVGLATHNTRDLGDERITNAFAHKFVFRSTAEDELTRVLRIAGLEDTPGTRKQIRTLLNGECILVDDRDVRDRLQWDWYDDELSDVLRTTPSGEVVA